MKINKSHLEQIIKEELQNIMNEESRFKIDNDQDEAKALVRLRSLRNKTFSGAYSGSRKKKANDELIRAIGRGVVKYNKRKDSRKAAAAEEEDLTTQAVYDQEQREKALGPNSSIDPNAAAKERDQEEYLQQDIEKGSKWLSGAAQTAKDAFGNFMKGTEQPAKKSSGRSKASRQATLSKRIGRPVANIQNRLRKYFHPGSKTFASGKADGKYGRPGGETERAIKNFQKNWMNDDNPDGLWGPGTEKGYKEIPGKKKSFLMMPPIGTEPQKGKPQKALAKSTGIKSIEQLKKEMAAAQSQANMTHKGGSSKSVKAAAMKDWHSAKKALQLAQAQELKGKQQGIALARGETKAERGKAIARERARVR